MYQELEVSAILTHLRQRNQTEKMHTMLTSVLLFTFKKNCRVAAVSLSPPSLVVRLMCHLACWYWNISVWKNPMCRY
jgi:hypothetical protein